MATFTQDDLDQLCPEFPHGPLDHYRKGASFDWRRFKLKFRTPQKLRFQEEVWAEMEADPIFSRKDEPADLKAFRAITYRFPN